MIIGWVGLGKLGLPCALSLAKVGFEVIGTDINPEVENFILNKSIPYEEIGVESAFKQGISVGWRNSIEEILSESDLVFVAVQTPHAPEFEGCTPVSEEFRDFDYTFLKNAIREICKVATKKVTVVVVSTTLPGTIDREIIPLIKQNENIRFAYSPAFIAMGTTMKDFSNPEMVIVGTEDDFAFQQIEEVHRRLHKSPILKLDIIECETVKMAYNTFIGLKIVFANTIGELCEKNGGDADKVMNALGQANERIISTKYLRPGMGDGGGCHPRDQLALSWLARRHNLSANIFEWLMQARDRQTEWQSLTLREIQAVTGLQVYICGREYKANSNLTVGSPSRLLMEFCKDFAEWQDSQPTEKGIYFIGVDHDKYKTWSFPKNSIVVDPWGIIPTSSLYSVVKLGRRSLQ